jgi:hypothetical protein
MIKDQNIVQNRDNQFSEIVLMIRRTKSTVISMANTALIDLYWQVGKYISNKIAVSEWGDGVVKQLAAYIEKNSPDTKGFSDKNLWRMKQFYETYCTADEKLSAVLRQIAPRADQVFRDQYVLEFLGGKDFLFIDEEYRLQLAR